MRVFVGAVLFLTGCGPSVHHQRLGVETRPGEIAIDQVAIERSVRTPDFRNLELIPAHQIDHIRILTGIEGTTYYGTNAEGGVILVYTKTGRES